MHLRNWCTDRKDYKIDVQVECASHSLWMINCPVRGVVKSCDPLRSLGCSNHITGTAEPKVVKFCTRVGHINSSNKMTYHQQKVVVMVT